jgi:hypothetical protein
VADPFFRYRRKGWDFAVTVTGTEGSGFPVTVTVTVTGFVDSILAEADSSVSDTVTGNLWRLILLPVLLPIHTVMSLRFTAEKPSHWSCSSLAEDAKFFLS